MAKKKSATLTPLQRAFVREFVASPDRRVRGNAKAAYLRAGGRAKTEASAAVAAHQVLINIKVQEAIQKVQAQADAETLLRLVDWKTAAIEAQPDLLALAQGYLPEGHPISDPMEAARGHVMLGAIKEIMDRGFPKQLYLKFDPREALAKLLGVPKERLPASMEEDEA